MSSDPIFGDVESSRVEARPSHPLRTSIRRIACEPLVHFMLLGGLIWGVGTHLKPPDKRPLISLSRARIQLIADHYRQQYGATPTPRQLGSLVEAAITEEIFYRKALELGLDRDDEIVRRRLVQKYEFLQQDLSDSQRPSEQVLRSFYADNAARYRLPERVTFTHVYFSPDHRGDEGARQAAEALAVALNQRHATRAADAGDTFPGPQDVAVLSAEDLTRVFGRDGLSEQVFATSPGHWSAPMRSGFGWHTVYVISRQPSVAAEYKVVHQQVEEDYLDAARARRNADSVEKLRREFEIVRE